MRVFEDELIVTNGDQTDTIYNYLQEGLHLRGGASHPRAFEPDAPNFTPRISGSGDAGQGDLLYKLSILKSDDGRPLPGAAVLL